MLVFGNGDHCGHLPVLFGLARSESRLVFSNVEKPILVLPATAENVEVFLYVHRDGPTEAAHHPDLLAYQGQNRQKARRKVRGNETFEEINVIKSIRALLLDRTDSLLLGLNGRVIGQVDAAVAGLPAPHAISYRRHVGGSPDVQHQ